MLLERPVLLEHLGQRLELVLQELREQQGLEELLLVQGFP